jgi:hypothetical protein
VGLETARAFIFTAFGLVTARTGLRSVFMATTFPFEHLPTNQRGYLYDKFSLQTGQINCKFDPAVSMRFTSRTRRSFTNGVEPIPASPKSKIGYGGGMQHPPEDENFMGFGRKVNEQFCKTNLAYYQERF